MERSRGTPTRTVSCGKFRNGGLAGRRTSPLTAVKHVWDAVTAMVGVGVATRTLQERAICDPHGEERLAEDKKWSVVRTCSPVLTRRTHLPH
jgi:hypothetical protein